MTLRSDKDLKISGGKSQRNFGLKKDYFFWVTLPKRVDVKYFSAYKILVP